MNRQIAAISTAAAGVIAAITMIFTMTGDKQATLSMAPGDLVTASCSGNLLNSARVNQTTYRLYCSGPTAVPTVAPTATAVSATPTAGPGSGCITNCGEPRFFCGPGNWAFCDDYRDLYCPSQAFLNDCTFPNAGSDTRLERRFGPFGVTASVLDATDPRYSPNVSGTLTPAGWFFNQQEHFHSQVEDGNFGLAIQRHHQPIDLSAERRVHFEVDLDTSARRYVRVLFSPDIAKVMVDDRDPANEFRPNLGLDFWILNGTYMVSSYPNQPDGGVFFTSSGRYYGANNVRDDVDIFISRTRFRVLINGVEKVNTAVPELAFDKAYVYLVQASYNPCKDEQCALAQQIKHWDNVAWTGPRLAPNSLTPAGMQDVAFNAYGQATCTVKGVLAAPMGPPQGYAWHTFVARMPVQTVAPSDVVCINGEGGNLWPGRQPRDFEVVKQ